MTIGWVHTLDAPEPPKAGWYAVTLCWDPEEGLFPETGRWTGTEWVGNDYPIQEVVVAYSSEPFATEKEAEAWADANDMERIR